MQAVYDIPMATDSKLIADQYNMNVKFEIQVKHYTNEIIKARAKGNYWIMTDTIGTVMIPEVAQAFREKQYLVENMGGYYKISWEKA